MLKCNMKSFSEAKIFAEYPQTGMKSIKGDAVCGCVGSVAFCKLNEAQLAHFKERFALLGVKVQSCAIPPLAKQ